MGKELQHTAGAGGVSASGSISQLLRRCLKWFFFILPIYAVCLEKMRFKDFIVDKMTG